MLCSERDNMRRVVLSSGQELELHLPSNPTTGYNWLFQVRPNESIFRLLEESYMPASGKPLLVGEGGNQRWTFASLSPGKTLLLLVYKRSWEKGPPLKTYQLQIEVR